MLTALGLVLQKYWHTKNKHMDTPTVYYKSGWWILGFVIFLTGQIINVVCMSLAPQAMLSCLGACSLIFNSVFARLILGEYILWQETGLMLLMIVGCAMVIISTPRTNLIDAVQDRPALVVQPLYSTRFIVLFSILLALLMLGRFVLWIVEEKEEEEGGRPRQQPEEEPSPPQRLEPLSPPRSRADAAAPPRLLSWSETRSLFWALVSAISSGYSITFFKCLSTLLVSLPLAAAVFRADFWVVLGIAIALCLLQVHTLQLALSQGRAMTVIPTVFAAGILAQIGVADCAFRELKGLTDIVPQVLFFSGVGIICLSIISLTRVRFSIEVGEEVRSPEDEEGKEVAKRGEASLETPASSRSQGFAPSPARQPSADCPGGGSGAVTLSVTGPVGLA